MRLVWVAVLCAGVCFIAVSAEMKMRDTPPAAAKIVDGPAYTRHEAKADPPQCPINAVRPGTALADVRGELSGYTMDFRGTRQDEDVYFVNAGICNAFLDFGSQGGELDSIQYGDGHTVFKEDAPKEEAPQASTKGFPVPEDMFVNAYVLANYHEGDLDKEQLAILAHDEYRMGASMDTKDLMVSKAIFPTRAMRALDYIDQMRRAQR